MKKYTVLVALLFAFTLSACGGGSDGDSSGSDLQQDACGSLGLQTRIVNGSECVDQNSPVVQITLISPKGDGFICSGTMISQVDVLTAAHCFFEDIAAAFITANGKRVNADSFTIHPGVGVSTTAVFNDAAILHLSKAANLPTLPIIASRQVAVGDDISIYGYGITERDPGDNSTAGTLRSGEMRVSNVTDNHIFAEFTGRGSNTCFGDSGGPAIYSFSDNGTPQIGIVGMTSTGVVSNCGPGDVTLFANAQNNTILDFIVSEVPSVVVR